MDTELIIIIVAMFLLIQYSPIEIEQQEPAELTENQINSNLILRIGQYTMPSDPLLGFFLIVGGGYVVVKWAARRF